MINIDNELIDLDHQALFTLAAWHDKQATILRERAHVLAGRQNQENDIDRRLQFLERIPATVMKYLRQGCSLDEAQAKTAVHADTLLATVEKRWQDFITIKDSKSLAQRNRLIMDLAAMGLKNRQIGDRVGLHEVSVSRIISKEKRRLISWRRDSKLTLVSDASGPSSSGRLYDHPYGQQFSPL